MYNRIYLLLDGLSGASRAFLKHKRNVGKAFGTRNGTIKMLNHTAKALKVKKAIPQSEKRTKEREEREDF